MGWTCPLDSVTELSNDIPKQKGMVSEKAERPSTFIQLWSGASFRVNWVKEFKGAMPHCTCKCYPRFFTEERFIRRGQVFIIVRRREIESKLGQLSLIWRVP